VASRVVTLSAIVAVVIAGTLLLPAAATARLLHYLNRGTNGHCPLYRGFEMCTGQVPSFDGSRLDMDVTLPKGTRPRGGYPLVVMIHGSAGPNGGKREMESTTDNANYADQYRWNTAWFARHGFYVLTFTQRGYRTDAPNAPYRPDTPTGTSVDPPNGTIHLVSREFSVRDTQWLAAQVASSFDVNPGRVIVTGRAPGGAESWLLASQRTWRFPHQRDRSLPLLRLRAALPRAGWTDASYGLAPSGHAGGRNGGDILEAATGRPGSDVGAGGPLGAVKQSYVGLIVADLSRNGAVLEDGTTQTPSEEGRVNVHAWLARGLSADPYEDPLAAQARRGLTEFRSAYYQDERWSSQRRGRKVPIFSIQGWTDDLFTAVESFREYRYLKRLNARWPVSIALGDVGTPNAHNPPPVWRELNKLAWRWLGRVLGGRRGRHTRPVPAITSYPTTCATPSRAPKPLTAPKLPTLARGELDITYSAAGALSWRSGTGDPNGKASDPFAGDPAAAAAGHGKCLPSPGPATGAYTAVSEALRARRTYVGLGKVVVKYNLTGLRASLNARLWDAPPADKGPPVLITRGTYMLDTRYGDRAAGTLRLPLFGNHWRLQAGHRLRLDLTQVDEPYLRPVSEPSALQLGSPTLRLPTRERRHARLTGSAVDTHP
jgi:hypothetical protein